MMKYIDINYKNTPDAYSINILNVIDLKKQNAFKDFR